MNDYVKYPATDFMTARTAKKYGISEVGKSLRADSGQGDNLDVFDDTEICVGSFNTRTKRFFFHTPLYTVLLKMKRKKIGK